MKYLYAWLKYKGISAYRLIQITGIQPTKIYDYVKNRETLTPRIITQRKIANAIGISVEELQRSPEGEQ